MVFYWSSWNGIRHPQVSETYVPRQSHANFFPSSQLPQLFQHLLCHIPLPPTLCSTASIWTSPTSTDYIIPTSDRRASLPISDRGASSFSNAQKTSWWICSSALDALKTQPRVTLNTPVASVLGWSLAVKPSDGPNLTPSLLVSLLLCTIKSWRLRAMSATRLREQSCHYPEWR